LSSGEKHKFYASVVQGWSSGVAILSLVCAWDNDNKD
jgi:hypothetical protein